MTVDSFGLPRLSFRVDRITDPEAAGRLWRRLEPVADATFFTSWTWLGSWLEVIGRPVFLLEAREGDEPVALGLFCASRQVRWGVVPVASLHLSETGDERIDVLLVEYNDLLVRAADAERIRAAVWRWLGGRDRLGGFRFDEIHLGNVSAARGAAAAAASGLRARVWARRPLGLVDLEALRASGRSFVDSLGRNTRHQIRRAMRLYEERGRLGVETPPDLGTARAWLAHAGELHQRRWTARGRPGAWAFPTYVRFAHSLLERGFDDGSVELLRIRAGEHIIGYLLNFVYRGHAFCYFGGLAYEEDNRIKPGLVAHCLAVQRYLERGCRIYDFGAGDFRYKFQLGRPGPAMETWILRRPRLKLEIEDLGRRLRARWRERRAATADAGGSAAQA
jgi:CelD/BcsL family acetyltransferase involved in cellulose biosynthesis